MVLSRCSLRICRSWKEPVWERSGGMTAVASHLPFTCRKKLSPALTDVSIEVRSTPHLPNLGAACASAGDVATKAGAVKKSAPHRKARKRVMLFLRKRYGLYGEDWGFSTVPFLAAPGSCSGGCSAGSTTTPRPIFLLPSSALVMATVTRTPGLSRSLSPTESADTLAPGLTSITASAWQASAQAKAGGDALPSQTVRFGPAPYCTAPR